VSITPPEANSEYSRGVGRSQPVDRDFSGAVRGAVLAAATLGVLLLIVSEFTALFTIKNGITGATIKTVSTGSHDSYALLPIALAAAALALLATARGNRTALVALGALGLVTLLIALLGDLPDAQSSGVIGSAASGYHQANASPSTGLYMETLGAILLIIASGCGLLLTGAPRPGTARAAPRSGS
jgi:hypothetical protein